MNLNAIRKYAIGALILVVVGLAAFMGNLRWQDTLEGKTTQLVYAEWSDGTIQYGPYCAKGEDGTRLEGGGICHVTEHRTAYTPSEAAAETIGVVLMVLAVLGFLGAWAIKSLFEHLARRQEAHRPAASANR